MKQVSIIFLLFFHLTSTSAQKHKNNKLYYYLSPKDSLLGVQDAHGKIIIPAQYNYWLNSMNSKEPIEDSIIFFSASSFSSQKISTSWGDAYDRNGKLLFHPMFYDNGPDDFNEDYTRCVKNDKVGYVNRKGEIVIEPQWDWATPFNYGYALVCNGCTISFEHDSEHPEVVYPESKDFYYINKKGEKVNPNPEAQNNKDYKVENGYLPYPFTYSQEEQLIIDSFNNCEIISLIYYANHFSSENEQKKNKLQFEIISTAHTQHTKYLLQCYERNEGKYRSVEQLSFVVSSNGDWFHFDQFTNEQIPFNKWLRIKRKNCSWFFKNYPDAPNKFDTKMYFKKKPSPKNKG